MSESNEMNTDRYVLEIEGATVKVVDTQTGTQIGGCCFTGSDRLINATQYVEQLNALTPSLAAGGVPTWQETPPTTPAAFLAGLPVYARQQRLNAMLIEVSEIEERYVTLLAEDARRLAEASALAKRLREALVRPPCSTLPGWKAPEVPEEGPRFPSLQRAAQRLVRVSGHQGSWPVTGLKISKPGPY